MADSKKYDGGQWEHSLRKQTTASEIIVPPTTIYADGSNITTYTIKGNTVQNGTPTPTNPIAVNGVGELDSGDYKIPISNGQQTTNIYLGSTQTVRQIKKLVLTGQENWGKSGSTQTFYMNPAGIDSSYKTAICDRFAYTGDSIGNFGTFYSPSTPNPQFNFVWDTSKTVDEWKAWLSENPTTLYYVLATAETTAVNEPLMKIGTYADTLSNAAQIPTTEGANSITVDTTVQPSEFTATWTGWHDAYAKEKSENMFDGTVRNAIINDSTGEETSNNNWRCSDFIKVADTTVTLSWVSDNQYYQAKLGYYEAADTETFLSTEVIQGNRYSGTFTIPEHCNYIKISYSVAVSGNPVTREDIMLNTGSTALPYEPYWE